MLDGSTLVKLSGRDVFVDPHYPIGVHRGRFTLRGSWEELSGRTWRYMEVAPGSRVWVLGGRPGPAEVAYVIRRQVGDREPTAPWYGYQDGLGCLVADDEIALLDAPDLP